MYSFSLALDGSTATVEDANALYDVCDGVQLRSIGGTAFVDADCDATSLEAAVDRAIAEIEQALPHAAYKTGRGCRCSALRLPVPTALLCRMIEFRIREYEQEGVKRM